MILAPLRGVTIRTFRGAYAGELKACGFKEAITPFIAANAGYDPLRDSELRCRDESGLVITPQFIGKDPQALTAALKRIKAAGYEYADLNCGCPYPMVRNKFRGSGLLKTPRVLAAMLAAGCETMGPGRFSVKARLGVDRPDELLELMALINEFPLRFLTVHGRIARQMYAGECDRAMVDKIVARAKMPVVINGDLPLQAAATGLTMVGRAFVRHLGEIEGAEALLREYIQRSQLELSGDNPVLGRIKELLSYWQDSPRWHRRWTVAKMARSVEELCLGLGLNYAPTAIRD